MALDSIQHPALVDSEVPFGPSEVFYSRTDGRGVIASANDIFCRISGYGWEQLSGAPHRIVRHPAMPRGVFHLLWDRLKEGRLTGAYVRNRARDGRHYWVFALVSPIEGGFLSVRLKPTGALLRTIAAEYADLRAREEAGLSPADSAAALVERIVRMGHVDYDDFMAQALAAELGSPLRAALRPTSPALRPIREIPMNLHISASRIETYGGPVATLAENYRLMVADITQRLEGVVGSKDAMGERMLASASLALLRLGMSQVHAELVAQPGAGVGSADAFDLASETALLQDLANRYAAEASASLTEVCRCAARLGSWCDDLKRLMLGLDSIRVLCRVEAGRLQLKGSSLESIIAQLDGFHAGIGARLDRITDLALSVSAQASAAMAR
jgi:PAS domain S-box-containing protein